MVFVLGVEESVPLDAVRRLQQQLLVVGVEDVDDEDSILLVEYIDSDA